MHANGTNAINKKLSVFVILGKSHLWTSFLCVWTCFVERDWACPHMCACACACIGREAETFALVCLHQCVSASMHVGICTHACLYMFAYLCPCIQVHVHLFTECREVSMCVFLYVHACKCACMWKFACAPVSMAQVHMHLYEYALAFACVSYVLRHRCLAYICIWAKRRHAHMLVWECDNKCPHVYMCVCVFRFRWFVHEYGCMSMCIYVKIGRVRAVRSAFFFLCLTVVTIKIIKSHVLQSWVVCVKMRCTLSYLVMNVKRQGISDSFMYHMGNII